MLDIHKKLCYIVQALSAGVAQLVEQLICNQQVGGSSPSTSSIFLIVNMGVFPSGQRGQTVNLLAPPSVVRIHPLPPNKRDLRKQVFFVCVCVRRTQHHFATLVANFISVSTELHSACGHKTKLSYDKQCYTLRCKRCDASHQRYCTSCKRMIYLP